MESAAVLVASGEVSLALENLGQWAHVFYTYTLCVELNFTHNLSDPSFFSWNRLVAEYICEFRSLVGKLRHWSERLLVHYFRGSLNQELYHIVVPEGLRLVIQKQLRPPSSYLTSMPDPLPLEVTNLCFISLHLEK